MVNLMVKKIIFVQNQGTFKISDQNISGYQLTAYDYYSTSCPPN